MIDTVTLVPVLPQDMKEKLESGEIDLLNKVVDGDVVNSMRPMLSEGYSLLNLCASGIWLLRLCLRAGAAAVQGGAAGD